MDSDLSVLKLKNGGVICLDEEDEVGLDCERWEGKFCFVCGKMA